MMDAVRLFTVRREVQVRRVRRQAGGMPPPRKITDDDTDDAGVEEGEEG